MNSVSTSLFQQRNKQRLACLWTSTFDKFLNRGIVIISYPLHVRGKRNTYDKIASKEFYGMNFINWSRSQFINDERNKPKVFQDSSFEWAENLEVQTMGFARDVT